VTTPPFEPVSERDVQLVTAMLGRPARDVIGIPARCVCGNPTVVATKPRLGDGTPFPTLYYLCHPGATAAISTLEANGVMAELTELLAADDDLRRRYHDAHDAYLADREGIEHVAEIAHVTAGGMPERVKCLHALAGHALSAGPGVNPLGDLAVERSSWSPDVCRCGDYLGEAGGDASDEAAAADGSAPSAATGAGGATAASSAPPEAG
jgi:hypothetical protein